MSFDCSMYISKFFLRKQLKERVVDLISSMARTWNLSLLVSVAWQYPKSWPSDRSHLYTGAEQSLWSLEKSLIFLEYVRLNSISQPTVVRPSLLLHLYKTRTTYLAFKRSQTTRSPIMSTAVSTCPQRTMALLVCNRPFPLSIFLLFPMSLDCQRVVQSRWHPQPTANTLSLELWISNREGWLHLRCQRCDTVPYPRAFRGTRQFVMICRNHRNEPFAVRPSLCLTAAWVISRPSSFFLWHFLYHTWGGLRAF